MGCKIQIAKKTHFFLLSVQCVLQYLVSHDRGQISQGTIDVFLHAKLLKG